jgi:glutathionylspermidine synthase
VTGFQRLHNGAIWQQYEKHNQLLEAVYDLAKEAVGKEKADAILEKHEVKRLQ